MRYAGCRPMGRLCCWVVMTIAPLGLWMAAGWAQSGPATTTVADNVYLADGTAAQGTMIVSWPAFETAGGAQVSAGTKNVPVTNGAFNVSLVPNAGASPAGVYYVVVYQLGPAVAARDIVDPEKFRQGIGLVIDGMVQCLNASAWAKSNGVLLTPKS